jgi:cysteine-rich repeat protein
MRLGTAAAVLALLPAVAASAASRRTVPCPDGGFGLDAPLPGDIGAGGALVGFRITGGKLEPLSGCRRSPRRLKPSGGAWRGRLRGCFRAASGYDLRVDVDADCAAIRGTVQRRHRRASPVPFVATRARCGDGRFDGIFNETCEGPLGCAAGFACSATCRCEPIPPSTTTSRPTTTTTSTTTTSTLPPPVCGNGVREPEGGELCDGTDVGDATCASEGFPHGGSLRCQASCMELDTSGCFRCGNGVLEPGEECDDGNGDTGDGCSPSCQREEPAPALH